MFAEKITHKIFEINCSFHVKQGAAAKVLFLVFKSFLQVLTKLSFWQEDWALGYHCMQLKKYPDTS